MSWKNKLQLEAGDELKFINKFEAGHLGQNERYLYEIIGSDGNLKGKVKYVEYTSVKAPFTETYSLQKI